MILSGEVSGKMNRVCCGAVKISMGNKSSPLCTFLQDRVCVAMKAPVGLSSGSTVCVANGGVSLRQVLDHVDSNFSSIENLWPQVDTCFRPFRATLKISEVEPQCTLKILQSKTCEKAKPLLMVTVHTERSSYPCFAAALSGSPTESVRSWRSISFRRLM